MCAVLRDSDESKSIQVTVQFAPRIYSRLALLAHRHELSLGDEIRAAVEAHIERHAEEAESA
jgi:hypothetical protein